MRAWIKHRELCLRRQDARSLLKDLPWLPLLVTRLVIMVKKKSPVWESSGLSRGWKELYIEDLKNLAKMYWWDPGK